RSSSTTSTMRSLPRAAMRPRVAPLPPLLAARLRIRRRRRRLHDVDELGRRLCGECVLGGLECGGADVAATAPAVDEHRLLVTREAAALRVLRLAFLPHAEERCGDEDRRVRTRGDADDEREGEVLERR